MGSCVAPVLFAAVAFLLCVGQCSAAASYEKMIAEKPVVLIGIPNMRCTLAAKRKFQSCGIEYSEKTFTPSDIQSSWSSFAKTTDGCWRYMDCKYHTEEGGMTMHSYVFAHGKFLGDGFDISSEPCSSFKVAAAYTKQVDKAL